MKILITGASGLIGRKCVEILSKKYSIIAVDKKFINKQKNNNIKYINIDVTNKKSFFKKIKIKKIDTAIHLAASLGVRNTESNTLSCLDVNIAGTKNFLDFCVAKKIKKVLFASSSEVYGNGYKSFIGENFDIMPRSAYGISKATGEYYFQGYSKKYKFNYFILRFFNVYGSQQRKDFVIPKFTEIIKKNKTIHIYGTGKQTRAFCHVDDAARAIKKVLEKGKHNTIYNVGNNLEPTNIINLAKKMIKLSGKKIKIRKLPFNKSDRSFLREIFNRKPNISKLIKDTNYYPTVSLSEGIRRMFFKNK